MNKTSRHNLSHNRKTCFISIPYNTDISPIKSILEKRGIKPIIVSELLDTNLQLSEKILKEISIADFILVILDSINNVAVYYELGIARAYNKEILLLVSSDSPKLNVPFLGLKYFIWDKNDAGSVETALD